jgi:hypothetical protein
VAPEEAILDATPRCRSRVRDGTPCSMCGMTRAFVLISSGRVEEASAMNRYAFPLYVGFVLNAAGCASFGAFALGRRKRRRTV